MEMALYKMASADIDLDFRKADIVFSIFTPFTTDQVKARASGVLLVAGVGSYCAYRICTKYLGRRFVWMLLDSSRVDQLASADLRLLYPTQIHPIIDDYEENEGDRESESEWRSRVSGSRPASEMSISRLQRMMRRSVRGKGLLAIHSSRSPRSGVLRRDCGSVAGSTKSLQQRATSPSVSECSASLRIVWEGQQTWDDEFAQPAYQQPSTISRIGCVGNAPYVSHNSALSQRDVHEAHEAPSMGDLCSVFDDILSVTTRDDQLDFRMNDFEETFREEELPIYEEDEQRNINSDEDLMQLKCMTDSKYMYQSVCVGSEFGGSEAGSMISIRSSASNLHSLKKRLNRTVKPTGLWDLSHDTASTSAGPLRVPNRNPMTDSGLSSGLRSETGKSQKLYDSALGADIFSSEDEGERDRPLRSRTLDQIPDEIERSSICPSQMSVTSLEWFDDGFKQLGKLPNSIQDFGPDIRVPINGLDFDFESLANGSNGSESRANSHRSFALPIFHRRPSDTRDLMVFACEKLQPYSEEFKTLQSLYSRRRLKRVCVPTSDSSQLLSSFLQSALYHDLPFFTERTKDELVQSITTYYGKYNVLHRWSVDSEGNSSSSLRQLQHAIGALWDLVHDPLSKVDDTSVESLRLLLLVRSIEIFESANSQDLNWFSPENPSEAANALTRDVPDELLWRLLAWSCNVRFEVINLSSMPRGSQTRKILEFGDRSATPLHWLSLQDQFYPLLYVPDD